MKIPMDMIPGTIHETKVNGKLKVVDYLSSINVTVEFIDTGYKTSAHACAIRRKEVKDPLRPIFYGVGYIGIGDKSFVKNKKAYRTWQGMIVRCYDESQRDKYPTYSECTVCSDWHNFQVFCEWFEANYIEGFAMDKDIISMGMKIYSPETCAFIPQPLNSIFSNHKAMGGKYKLGVCTHKSTGNFLAQININGKRKHLGVFNNEDDAYEAYCKRKRQYILDSAEEYRKDPRHDERVYSALVNYWADNFDS